MRRRIDEVQVEWHGYVRRLKGILSGEGLRLREKARSRPSTNSVTKAGQTN